MSNLSLLFQGDSITDCGRPKDFDGYNDCFGSGYVAMIASRILCDYPDSKIYNRGYGGNRIVDMYARWHEDALNIPFNVISILNGINDVGFGIRRGCGADAKKFEFVYDRILYETKETKPDADILLCEPFIVKRVYERENDIYENWDIWNKALIERADIVRSLADKYGCTFIKIRPALDGALKRAPAEHWSRDCIHPTYAGNEVIARTWLEQAKPVLDKYLK